MSRGGFSAQPPNNVSPEKQVKIFADLYRDRIDSAAYKILKRRASHLGLYFTEDETKILAALDTPEKVQEFLNTQIYYNKDHGPDESEETAMSPKQVLRTAKAHCFEGAMFAYAVNILHGHNPRLLLLEASQDSEHNLVLFEDPESKLFGANAHSAFPHLDGRPAEYRSIRALAESYHPFYYSDRTFDPTDLTLVGYSEPFDIIPKFGVSWVASDAPLWDIYYTFIDDMIPFHYLFDDGTETHLYPLIQALKSGWITIDRGNRPSVNVAALPSDAKELWPVFWSVFDQKEERPRGKARRIESEFRTITGTTPIDLEENVEELENFLERGYRVEQLLTKHN